jgi:hypothetical protein
MATQSELLESWTACKIGRRHFYRLQEPCLQEFEYRGPQMGHPSNYAAVRFPCEPLNTLALQTAASWPVHLPRTYWADLERAIAEAIVDGLMSPFTP